MLLLIESDSHDATLEHEEQTVGRNRLIITSSAIRVSRGLAGMNCMTVCEAVRAALQSSWVFVNRMTFSQVTQASTMCDIHSSDVIGSPILGRVDMKGCVTRASAC